MMRFAVAITLALSTPTLARAGESVAQCLDPARHPSLDDKRTCLEVTRDIAAIPELHKLALGIVAANGPGGAMRGDFDALADSAGEVATFSDDTLLFERARSAENADRAFAVRALVQERNNLRPDDPKRPRAALEARLRPVCEGFRDAADEAVRAAANRCLRVTGPGAVSGVPKGSTGLLSGARNLDAIFGPGGLGGGPGPSGPPLPPPPVVSCGRGLLPDALELCVADRTMLSVARHLDVPAGPPGRWVRDTMRSTGESRRGHDTLARIRLEGGEDDGVATRGVSVLGKLGTRHLLLVPVVSGKAAPYARSRALLVVFDESARELRSMWESRPCTRACEVPRAEAVSGANGIEVRVRPAGGGDAGVQRLRWTGATIEHVK